MPVTGSVLQYSWDIASIGDSISVEEGAVGSGIEFDLGDAIFLDIREDKVAVSATALSTYGTGFNGFVIRDIHDELPDIAGITFLSNRAGYDPAKVTFNSDAVFISIGIMSFVPHDQFKFRMEFAPTDMSLSHSSVSENAKGAEIGVLATSDFNVDDNFSYEVDDQRFAVVDGVLKLRYGQRLDYEADHEIDISVTATDDGDLTFTKTFRVEVEDELDRFTGDAANDRLIGDVGDDILRGRGGDDVLRGLGGNDNLRSIGGNDRLIGGEGADIYVFSTGSDRDTIVGFEAGVDKIDISRWAAIGDLSGLARHATNRDGDLWIAAASDVLIIRDMQKADMGSGGDFIF